MDNSLFNWWDSFENIEHSSDSIWTQDSRDELMYIVSMFPYPSGTGLHMWHVANYAVWSIVACVAKMQWKKVIHPIGWDGFWLPTENQAISEWIMPDEVWRRNTERFKEQLQAVEINFDWERLIDTTDPNYYKFTQGLFLKLVEKWLVKKIKTLQPFCNGECQTVLAQSQIENWKCERCKWEIWEKEWDDYVLSITKYADRLDKDLDTVDWPEETIKNQRNWIGKEKWYECKFQFWGQELLVFMTNMEILRMTPALLMSPERAVSLWINDDFWLVDEIQNQASTKTERDRLSWKNQLSTQLEVKIIHPITQRKIPVIVTDCLVWTWERSIQLWDIDNTLHSRIFKTNSIEINNDDFNDPDIISQDHERVVTEKTRYKLRDWSIWRQRYWGVPIPVYYDKDGNWHPMDESELPLKLPTDLWIKDIQPYGKPPLSLSQDFKVSEWWKEIEREVLTMDSFMCSAWYYFRFLDPENWDEFASQKALEWMPVDMYIWGKEHTNWHLLYARFITKVLYDLGLSPVNEPFKKLVHQWMILGEDGRKMSKRYGNWIDPMELIDAGYSADVIKAYLLSLWPVSKDKKWDQSRLDWMKSFSEKLERVGDYSIDDYEWNEIRMKKRSSEVHKFIRDYSHDMSEMKFNTAISKLFSFVNSISDSNPLSREHLSVLLKLAHPFFYHITHRLWNENNLEWSLSQWWPNHDESKIEKQTVTIWVQIWWKKRWTVDVLDGDDENSLFLKIKWDDTILKLLGYKEPKKIIYVPWRILNIVL